jgi:tripartite-type tricarboxylate transporter receptor subunit TctC
MKLPRRQFLHLATVAAALTILSGILANYDAWCQTARTIKVVVPFPPGGAVDISARLLAEAIDRAHGPTMVIVNRPGAGSVIATEDVSRATSDGTTLLMAANSFVINPYLRKLNYDPLTSFAPICYLVRSPPAAFGVLIAGAIIAQLGGYGNAAMTIATVYLLGLAAAPFLPETLGKPLPR